MSATADEQKFLRLLAEAILATTSGEAGIARQLAEEAMALAPAA